MRKEWNSKREKNIFMQTLLSSTGEIEKIGSENQNKLYVYFSKTRQLSSE
jgi:hypothetical protein